MERGETQTRNQERDRERERVRRTRSSLRRDGNKEEFIFGLPYALVISTVCAATLNRGCGLVFEEDVLGLMFFFST